MPPDPWGSPLGKAMKKYGPAVGVVLAVTLLGDRFWSIYSRHGSDAQATFEIGHMPTCASESVRQLLKQTLEESASAKNLKVFKVGAVDDVTPRPAGQPDAPNPDGRTCLSEVFSNDGHIFIHSELSWADADKSELYLEVKDVMRL